jgi:large subunit ribosomal protein L4
MSRLAIFDVNGKKDGDMEIADSILILTRGRQAVHDTVVADRAAKRAGTASTLRKGEVAGSNRKPWRQKGTGRARAGYRRSPIWRGGGVAFGPHPRSYKKKVNRKTNRLAFARAFSEKVTSGGVRLVKNLGLPEPKTKLLASLLEALGIKGSVILILSHPDRNLTLAARNISRVTTATADTATTYQILEHEAVVVDVSAVENLKARLGRVASGVSS